MFVQVCVRTRPREPLAIERCFILANSELAKFEIQPISPRIKILFKNRQGRPTHTTWHFLAPQSLPAVARPSHTVRKFSYHFSVNLEINRFAECPPNLNPEYTQYSPLCIRRPFICAAIN